jgi:hypothetical protein
VVRYTFTARDLHSLLLAGLPGAPEMWISAFVLLLKFGGAAFDESQQFGGHFQARRRGIGHWFAEHHAHDSDHLGPDATVEITINPR